MLTDQQKEQLDEIKDKVAIAEYGRDYCLLSDSQRIHLTGLIAIEYHRHKSAPTIKGHSKETFPIFTGRINS